MAKANYKIYILKDPRTQEIRYVGVTCQPLYQRLSNHLYYAKKRNCTHVHNWILSLMNENLKPNIEVIEHVTKDNWEKKERYWIKHYKLKTNLTNIDEGGRGLIKSRTLTSRQRSALSHQKPILQLNMQGDVEKEFNSIKEAFLTTGISRTSIGNVLANRSKTAGGYQWIYKSDYSEIIKYNSDNVNKIGYSKQILRKNVDNKETIIYNSIEDACVSNNLSRSYILTIIRNMQTICGYEFLFYKVEDIV
jgi:hypothetical protein